MTVAVPYICIIYERQIELFVKFEMEIRLGKGVDEGMKHLVILMKR